MAGEASDHEELLERACGGDCGALTELFQRYRGRLEQMVRLTSASRAAIRAETQLRVQEALNAMDPVDREALALRHFDMLSNEETVQVLGLKPLVASNHHIRALKRLKEIMAQVPDSGENSPGP
jgi:hypothetical protein